MKVEKSSTKSWLDAREKCQTEGGDLVRIENSAMNLFVWGIVLRQRVKTSLSYHFGKSQTYGKMKLTYRCKRENDIYLIEQSD